MIYVGPAGWSYADWEGRVYPSKKPRGFHPLAYLTRFVDCLEVNSTFYAPPRPAVTRNWCRLLDQSEAPVPPVPAVPPAPKPGFRLLAKLNQEFTHGRLPAGDGEGRRVSGKTSGKAGGRSSGRTSTEAVDWEALARVFLDGIQPLRSAGRLSALLVQFPASFTCTPLAYERLTRIRDLFAGLPLVLELRHRSWFESEQLAQLSRMEYSLAHIDLPTAADHPPEWHEPTGPIGYLRLHGRNSEHWFRRKSSRDDRYDYLYSEEELEGLVARAKHLAGMHDEVYVITNNHFGGQAMANAIEILAALAGQPVLAPATLLRAYPHLAGCARPEGQGNLF